ncbi:MAG: hypothetical protein GY807_21180 [Gammaproteobacteria bacterium]|nr:hypothetical protein [Gammaproteobacteria bacterium]
MKCYTKSDLFKATRKKAVEASYLDRHGTKAATREEYVKQNTKPCLSCGDDFFSKPSHKAKFCSTMCYRTYMAERFDRWVANPEEMALPQNYDEFLTQNELSCLVDGCDWKGQSLSGHMNLCHGVPKDEFKRAAGFNLSTGVISKELHETLVEREGVGVAALTQDQRREFMLGDKRPKDVTRNYRSLEAAEHGIKGRSLALKAGDYPTRRCNGCKTLFRQSTPFGKAKFCSVACRYKKHQDRLKVKKHAMTCFVCSSNFLGNDYQKKRFDKGDVVVCSITCRQHRAGKIARGTWDNTA